MNKYITRDEYLEAKNVALELEIQEGDNESKKVPQFIREVTDWCIEYLISEYGVNELCNFQALKEFRQIQFRKGVIEQIEYVISNGWINKDSGIDTSSRAILDYSRVQLGRTAYLKFKLGAFCNIVTY